jgi:omega-6 fatty acid desaturase (delta-12 desaturase)
MKQGQAGSQVRVAGTLSSFRGYSRASALSIFLADLLLCVATFTGFFFAPSEGWRWVAGLGYGFAISLMFIVAHDCGHLSFSGAPALDRWLGRVAFLPVLHSFSLWAYSHNRLHHGFTNLKHYDCVCAPTSKAEYDAFPPWRRLLERLYRHPLGFGVYYCVEVWFKRLWVPWPGLPRTRTTILDSALVIVFLSAQLTVIVLGSRAMGIPLWQAVLGLVVLPQAFWNQMMGITVYVQHTHPRVRWFSHRSEWSFFRAQVGGAVHIRWSKPIDVLFHAVMNHTAHHVDPHIPIYRLAEAQAHLEALHPETVPTLDWNWPDILKTARCCKLYDFERHCWTDFEGRPTTDEGHLQASSPAAAWHESPTRSR